MGLGYAELQDLALFVDQQVQLETVEPSHVGLARGGRPVKDLVAFYPLVVHPDLGGIGEGYAGTLAQCGGLQKQGHCQKAPAHKLGEAFVGYGPWEIGIHMQHYTV